MQRQKKRLPILLTILVLTILSTTMVVAPVGAIDPEVLKREVPTGYSLELVGPKATAEWTQAEKHRGLYSAELYVYDGSVDWAGADIPVDIAIEDIYELKFWEKVDLLDASGWDVNIILGVDCDGDGVFESNLADWHIGPGQHTAQALGDDSFVEMDGMYGVIGYPPGLAADLSWTEVDAYNAPRMGWAWWTPKADGTGFAYFGTMTSGGLDDFQAWLDGCTDDGRIDKGDRVKVIKLVIGGSGSWKDEIAYVDEIKMNGVVYDLAPVTTYALSLSPASSPTRIQEGESVDITLNVVEAVPDTTYSFDFIVEDPSTGIPNRATRSFAFDPDFETTVTYPDDFSGGSPHLAATDLVGTYYVRVDRTSPTGFVGILSTDFVVKLTDEDSYQRTETVEIQGAGYGPNEWVWVNITYAGASVDGYPKQVQANGSGFVLDSWVIPKGAGLGTYTVDLRGTTTTKLVKDTQTFTVSKADLAATWNFYSGQSQQRTLSIGGKVKVTYPGGQVMDDVDLGANTFDIKVYKAGSPTGYYVTVSAADWDGIDSFDFSWTIPKDAALGADYQFAIEADAISDSYSPPNTGPTVLTYSYPFNVVKADLTIDIITDAQVSTADPNDGDGDIERTETVIFEFKVQYPDLSYFASSDFGSITTTLYYGAGSKCSVTSISADTLYQDLSYGNLTIYFDSGSEVFTVKWKIPINADLTDGDKYNFTITGYDIVTPTPNSLIASQDSSAFDVLKADLAVSDVVIVEDSVQRTETITVTFHVDYPDDSHPTKLIAGTIQLEDGTVLTFPRPFPIVGSDGDFSVVIDTAPDTPTGVYKAVVKAGTLNDGYGNIGSLSDEESLPDVVTIEEATLYVVVTSVYPSYGGLSIVYFIAEIDYPDGTDFSVTPYGGFAYADIWIDANRNNQVDYGEFVVVEDLWLNYYSGNVWEGEHDLYPPGAINGTYKIKVHAVDAYKNFGEGEDFFDVFPETMKEPTYGTVGSEVDIWGSGFAPDMDVSIMWEMYIWEDYVGIGDGVKTQFVLGLGYVFDETIYLNGEPVPEYYYEINPWGGVVTFYTPPAYGVTITADYGILLSLAQTRTNEYGSFYATFIVPESYAGEHWVIAFQGYVGNPILYAKDIFEVEPQIVLSSTKGPPEAWITVTGTGFAANEWVDISAWLYDPCFGYYEVSYAYVVTDEYGTFAEAIALPSCSPALIARLMDGGTPCIPIVVEADDGDNWDVTFYLSLLWCASEPSSIDVDVEVGELYFPGEVMTVYVLTSVDGVPTDVENIEFMLYAETLGPFTVRDPLRPFHVDTGLYAFTATLPGEMQPGNYLFKVEASKTTYWYSELVDGEWFWDWLIWFKDIGEYEIADAWYEFGYMYEGYWPVTIHGVGIEGFVISPTLMGMDAWIKDIKGEIAEIIIPGIRTVQITLDSIRTQELAELLSNTAEILDNQEALAGLLSDVYTELGLTHADLAELMVFVYEDLEWKIDDLALLVEEVYADLSEELSWTHTDLVGLITSIANALQIGHDTLAELITDVWADLGSDHDALVVLITGIAEKLQMEHEALAGLIAGISEQMTLEHGKLADLVIDVYFELSDELYWTYVDLEELIAGVAEKLQMDIGDLSSFVAEVWIDLGADHDALVELITFLETKLQMEHADLAELIATVYARLSEEISLESGYLADLIADLKVQLELDLGELADLILSVEAKLQGEHGDILALIAGVADKLQMEHKALGTLIYEVFDALEIKLDDIKAEIIAIEYKVDGYYLTIETMLGKLELKLDETVIPFLIDIEAKLDFILDEEEGPLFLIYTAIGDIEIKMDEKAFELLKAINATLVSMGEDVEGYYLSLSTVLGDLELKLDYIVEVMDLEIVGLRETMDGLYLDLNSTLGELEVKLDDMGDFLVEIESEIIGIEEKFDEAYLTISTTLGELEVKLDYINATVVSVDGKCAEILLRIGTPTSTIFSELATIKGTIVSVDENVATIETDVGEMVLALPPLQDILKAGFAATSMYMPLEVILSLFALIAAIAACILITKKVV